MPFGMDFGFNNQHQVTQQNSQTDQSQSSRQNTNQSQTQSRSIAGAGGAESDILQQLLSGLTGAMGSARGLVESGGSDAIKTAIDNYNRVMKEGTSAAIGQMAKTGMNSTLLNGMVGSLQERAGAGLSGTLMNIQANMPMQVLNSISSVASPISNLLQGYFLNERAQNVVSSGESQGFSSSYGSSHGTTSGSSTGETSGMQFGFKTS